MLKGCLTNLLEYNTILASDPSIFDEEIVWSLASTQYNLDCKHFSSTKYNKHNNLKLQVLCIFFLNSSMLQLQIVFLDRHTTELFKDNKCMCYKCKYLHRFLNPIIINLSVTKSMVRPFGHLTPAVWRVVLWLPSNPALSIFGYLPQSDQNMNLTKKDMLNDWTLKW